MKCIYLSFILYFFFVLIGNLVSNVPYSFAINASAVVTLGLSVTIFMGVTILSLYKHGIKFFSFFIVKALKRKEREYNKTSDNRPSKLKRPVALIVIVGNVTSSKIYNNLKLGIAMANKTTAGNIVHRTSIRVP